MSAPFAPSVSRPDAPRPRRRSRAWIAGLAAAAWAIAGCGAAADDPFEATLAAAAKDVGLDVARWQSCRGSPAPAARVDEDLALGQKLPVAGTPTLVFDGRVIVGYQTASQLEALFGAAVDAVQTSGQTPDAYYAQHAASLPIGDAPVRGSATPTVTIVEFADFQCPYCGMESEPLKALVAAHADQVRVAFKHYPLSFHAHARAASIAAECARAQGKFWELHDAMYARQAELFGW